MKRKLLISRSSHHNWLVLTACLMFWCTMAFAQSDNGSVSGKFSISANSDYRVTVSWGSNLPYYDPSSATICHSGRHHRVTILGQTINYGDNSPAAGSFSFELGPSRIDIIEANYEWGNNKTGCTAKWGSDYKSYSTQKIKAPKNLSATASISPSFAVTLNWQKGTEIPDDKIQYLIKRNGATIATIDGGQLTYKDLLVLPGNTYSYTVQTIVSDNAPADWVRDVSVITSGSSTSTTTAAFPITATKDQRNVIKLKWPSFNTLKGIDAINVYRNGTLLTDITKTATTYNDNDVVPGTYYNYYLKLVSDGTNTALDNFMTNTQQGRSLPNGKLSGYVRGRTNAGVEGVIINAFSKTKLADGSGGLDSVYHYSTMTGPDGYYEIPDIFYTDEAEYCLKPTFPGYNKKRFDPDSLFRKLVLDDYNLKNINFTDTASLAISGKVYFTAITDSNNVAIKLPLEGAEVWLDGKNSNVRSKADGSYSVSVLQSGNHSVELKFKDHPISVLATTNPIRNILVNTLVNNIDFEDTKTDTLQIKVAASCDAPIGENVNVIVNSKSNGVTSAGASLKYNQKFTIRSADFQNTLHPNQTESGVINLILPATAYQAQVSLIKEKDAQGQPIINSNKLEYFKQNYTLLEANLSARDTIVDSVRYASITQITPTRQDTVFKDSIIKTAQLHNLSFIYYNNLRLKINNDNPIFTDSVFFASAGKNKLLLEQNDKPIVNIKIQETYSYRGITYNCDLDTGRVFIFDNISDIVSRQDFMLDSTGVVKYRLNVGKPVLEAPFEKSIQIVAKVGARETSRSFNAVVLGQRARNSTFVTKTPAIPLFVLHDPPGDNSFATIQKGTSISTTRTAALSFGGGAEVYTDLKVGGGVNIPFVGATGVAVRFNASVEGGADRNSSKTLTVTTTFDESFSTSSDESLVGHDGDVYVGASLNMIYALTDVIDYDAEKKDIKRDTSLAVDYSGFNTTFLYTEHQIKNTIIPQLETLYSISRSTYEKANQKYKAGDKSISNDALAKMFQEQGENKANIDAWQAALANNALTRIKAKERKLPDGIDGVVNGNISFSAGAIYDNSFSTDSLRDTTITVSGYLNAEVGGAFETTAGDFNSNIVGAMAKFRFSSVKDKSNQNQKTVTTTYHLEDNDVGDFFSVNLREDPNYGTPIFQTLSGSSSCPHEDNTQYRHLPAIQVVGTNEQRNVPSDQTAKFEIAISNRSESDEAVEYAVKLDPASNPFGAKVTVGGQDVTNGDAVFYIPTGKSFKLPVEVSRGPLSSSYDSLSLVIYSTCDRSLADIDGTNLAKPVVKLNAYFQNKCSAIDLFIPGDNWVVNQSNADRLFVAFSKYDASAASPLTTVGLEYRKLNTDFENTQWTTAATFPKSELKDKYYDYAFDVSGLPDGNYQVRAIAVCKGVDVNYSPVYTGKIDRQSAVAFGLPSPKNGILTSSDIIGVTFNKDIVFDNAAKPITAKLIDKASGTEIPVKVIGDGRNFELRPLDENTLNAYENNELIASLSNLVDVNGNTVTDTIKWSFVVNKSSVYWNPSSVVVDATENVQSTFSAKLTNKSALNQNFELSKYPSWLVPSLTSGKILPQADINLDFAVSKNLNTGIYTDTVIAKVDNKVQFLYVTVNVYKEQPNWTVNPANYKYNMGLTLQFSVDQSDTLTSKDIKDKIAVFVGNQVRGVGNIQYDAVQKKYVAFLTAYSNTSASEDLSFRLWDAFPGIEYQSKERIAFFSNSLVGNLSNPLIVHPEGVYQTIPLKQGWNWFSLDVKTKDLSIKNILGTLKSSEGDVIKSLNDNNSFSQFSSSLGWVGNLDSLQLTSSYMLNVNKADTIKVLGNFISDYANVKLNKGWNWIGYPMPMNMEVGNYFKNFNPEDGLKLVSQDEFTSYNATTKSWEGSLKYLRPGKGYRLFTSQDNLLIPIIPYNPAVVSLSNNFATVPVYNASLPQIVNNSHSSIGSTIFNDLVVDGAAFENSMSVTSVINQGGTIVNNADNRYEIYLYLDDKLVNIVNQTELPNGASVGFLPVASNASDEGKPIVVKIYDKVNKKLYTAQLLKPEAKKTNAANKKIKTNGVSVAAKGVALLANGDDLLQSSDQIVGSVENPLVLILEGETDIEVTNQIGKNEINSDDLINYLVTIRNKGNDVALNVNISDSLSNNFEYISADGGLSYNFIDGTLSTSFPTLNVGEEKQFNVVLKPKKIGVLSLGNGQVSAKNDVNLENNKLNPIIITVLDPRFNFSKLIIPTLFTPNGDGINDVFKIIGLNEFYVSNSLVVYNKNYNKVYQKLNYQNDWNGDNLPMGSYGYILKATDKYGVEQVFKGHFSIIYQ